MSLWRERFDWAICQYLLTANNSMIGGPNKIVEIDESKFGKMKYNRGARREGTWVVGGTERGSGKCFLVSCPNNKRDAATLLPLIRNHVAPGTTIFTDQCSSYNTLQQSHPHMTVNHSLYFVDPNTGVHINQCEGSWKHAKYMIRGGDNLDNVLGRFMFNHHFNVTGNDKFINAWNGYLVVFQTVYG